LRSDNLEKFWLLATFLLIAIILISCYLIWVRPNQGQQIEILDTQPAQYEAQISVAGAVNNPGIYPLKSDDTMDTILQASGGTLESADLSRLKLSVPATNEVDSPQKIDLNSAEAWLFEALPDIGPTRSKAIIQYREQNGLFHNIEELANVPGINSSTFEKIKNLITVNN
jgi:competence protein ComEA